MRSFFGRSFFCLIKCPLYFYEPVNESTTNSLARERHTQLYLEKKDERDGL